MKIHHFIKTLWALLVLCCAAPSLFGQYNFNAFYNPMPVPPLMLGQNNTFNLTAKMTTHVFNPNQLATDSLRLNQPIPTFSYNETGANAVTYLGPTMLWKRLAPLQINVTNALSASTTVHWHGLNLPSRTDGGPQEVIPAGTVWSPAFTNIDPVQTVWYHSHLMDATTQQVNMGLAGMIIIEDDNDPLRAQVPHEYGVNDFPIVIQEKKFNFMGVNAASIPLSHQPGNGPYTLINGVTNPVLRVPAQMVRLRMLNGSIRKTFQVAVSKNLTGNNFEEMMLIATDGGYTSQPFDFDSTLIAPGERMEFVIDFQGMSNGETLYLRNLVRSIPGSIVGAGANGTPGNAFLAFVIDNSIQPADPILSLPSTMLPYTVDTTDVFRRRTKHLEITTPPNPPGGGGTWNIDGTPMNMGVINDILLVDKKEMWTIVNNTTIDHPFHIHKVQTQVVSIEDMRTGIKRTFPDLPKNWLGYKDDILVPDSTKVTFIADFDFYGDTGLDTLDAFMYHCHILTHEDGAMMHQFVVVDSATYYSTLSAVNTPEEPAPFIVFPNPASDMIHLRGATESPARLRLLDITGRTLKEGIIPAFEDMYSIPVGDLPRGMVIIEWSTAERRHSKKVFLK